MPINQPHPAGVGHFGKNVLIQTKSVYLHDHRNAYGFSNDTTADIANHRFQNLVSADNLAKHAIIHKTERNALYTADDNELIVLCVSTNPSMPDDHRVIQSENPPHQIVELMMKDGSSYRSSFPWLTEFLELDFETATKIAVLKVRSEASEYEKEFSHFLDIILPGDPTAELAFRLLCEARVACGSDDEKEMGGLKIYAPKDLAAWLAPFAVSVNGDQKIAAVVAMMGSETAKKAAKAVFDALERNENALEEAKVFPGVSELVPSSTPSQERGAA